MKTILTIVLDGVKLDSKQIMVMSDTQDEVNGVQVGQPTPDAVPTTNTSADAEAPVAMPPATPTASPADAEMTPPTDTATPTEPVAQ